MKNSFQIILLILLIGPLAGAMISSCSDDDGCLSQRSMFLCTVNRIETLGSGENQRDTLLKDTLESLHITTLGSDSILLNNQQNVYSFSIPLQLTQDSTALVFHYANASRDTIIIRHHNTPYFISMDCGFEVRQVLLSTQPTHYALRSITINRNTIANDGTANLLFIY